MNQGEIKELNIKYKIIPRSYMRNLFLLNMIRYLWYNQTYSNSSEDFFTYLYEHPEIEDPILRLSSANKFANDRLSPNYGDGFYHSNFASKSQVRSITLDEFTNTKELFISALLKL